MPTILDPVGVPRERDDSRAHVLPSLAGRSVAILTNRWKSMDRMAERMAERLREAYGVAAVRVLGIPINGPMGAEVRDAVLAECDAAIVGLAN